MDVLFYKETTVICGGGNTTKTLVHIFGGRVSLCYLLTYFRKLAIYFEWFCS